jgi:tetratricopeptide (TPR) repeat protein
MSYLATAYAWLAHFYLESGRLDEAEVFCRKAIQLSPGLSRAYIFLGNIYSVRGRLETAIRCFEIGIKVEPGNPYARQQLGWTLYRQGRWSSAVDAYKRAVDLWWFKARRNRQILTAPLLMLGWAQCRAGRWNECLKSLEDSCKSQKNGHGDCGQWIVMALAHWKLGTETELSEQERAKHRAEARQLYQRSAPKIERLARRGPPSPILTFLVGFRTEAQKAMDIPVRARRPQKGRPATARR